MRLRIGKLECGHYCLVAEYASRVERHGHYDGKDRALDALERAGAELTGVLGTPKKGLETEVLRPLTAEAFDMVVIQGEAECTGAFESLGIVEFACGHWGVAFEVGGRVLPSGHYPSHVELADALERAALALGLRAEDAPVPPGLLRAMTPEHFRMFVAGTGESA